MAWYSKGCSLNSLGRYDEAVRCYEKALEIDPRFAMAWNNKGASLGNLGRYRYDEAIRCYEKALEIDPRIAAAWYNKAHAEESLGRREAGAKSYRHFIACAPPQYAAQVAEARQRSAELEGR
jgi:tetratricopeptide (TPR) repeat protein